MTSDFPLALHILGFLTAREGRPLTSEVMAETYGTNPVVVRRVLAKLKKAGLVDSQRGVSGGSVLVKDPAEIDLRTVFHAVHDPSGILSRPSGEDGTVSGVLSNYVFSLFDRAEEALLAELGGVTIAEMDKEVRPEICAFFSKRNS
ncbi:MAG: Rrf2 family transcriptional regulator [Verrucomicrobiota bacterium]